MLTRKRVFGILMGLTLAVTGNVLADAQPTDATQIVNTSLDASQFDESVKPGQDFFSYVNGKWIKKTQIPASESAWGSFAIVRKNNEDSLHNILNQLAEQKNAPGSYQQLVADYFASGLDTEKTNEAGAKPIEPILKEIAAIASAKDFSRELAKLHLYGQSPFWSSYVGPDAKNVSVNTLDFGQDGLSLTDRDDYLNNDARSKGLRSAFLVYANKIFTLLGDSSAEAKKKAAAILALETEIAKASKSRVELRDPVANYHKLTRAQLAKTAPNVDWPVYFTQLGAPNISTLVVDQPEFIKAADAILARGDWPTLRAYLTLSFVDGVARNLGDNFRNANFAFRGKAIRGAKEITPQWQETIRQIDGVLPDAMGQAFVAKNFSPQAKARVKNMVSHLISVYRTRLQSNPWMSAATKQKALAKLATFMPKLGYPDKWYKYPNLKISRDSYVLNVLNARWHNNKRDIAKIGHAVDRKEWGMSASTVNAYYNPTLNEIVFPAGIMQPPFFDANGDEAVNYGAIGLVIGHEITHGFDDSGSQFDASGNMKNWWTAQDRKEFDKRTTELADQYSQYEPISGAHINGKLTLGENIADLGGANVSLQAMRQALKAGQVEKDKVDGFTPDQRFFIGFARCWRVKQRDASLKTQLVVDPHSPAKYRVNGVITNMPEFYEAFDVQPGDALYKAQATRAKIW